MQPELDDELYLIDVDHAERPDGPLTTAELRWTSRFWAEQPSFKGRKLPPLPVYPIPSETTGPSNTANLVKTSMTGELPPTPQPGKYGPRLQEQTEYARRAILASLEDSVQQRRGIAEREAAVCRI